MLTEKLLTNKTFNRLANTQFLCVWFGNAVLLVHSWSCLIRRFSVQPMSVTPLPNKKLSVKPFSFFTVAVSSIIILKVTDSLEIPLTFSWLSMSSARPLQERSWFSNSWSIIGTSRCDEEDVSGQIGRERNWGCGREDTYQVVSWHRAWNSVLKAFSKTIRRSLTNLQDTIISEKAT